MQPRTPIIVKKRYAGELLLVIYDISDDKLRQRVSDFLKSKGFSRVQKSAFIGRSLPAIRVEVEAGLKRIIRGKQGVNIQIYPIPPSSFNRRVVIGDFLFEDSGGVEVF